MDLLAGIGSSSTRIPASLSGELETEIALQRRALPRPFKSCVDFYSWSTRARMANNSIEEGGAGSLIDLNRRL
jgi:hypothetical protein